MTASRAPGDAAELPTSIFLDIRTLWFSEGRGRAQRSSTSSSSWSSCSLPRLSTCPFPTLSDCPWLVADTRSGTRKLVQPKERTENKVRTQLDRRCQRQGREEALRCFLKDPIQAMQEKKALSSRGRGRLRGFLEIGRASCRERV